jgi:hypothetical protein
MSHVAGHLKLVQRKRGPVYYLRYRLADGRHVQTMLGPKWTERSGRPPAGFYTEKTAKQALQAVLADARRGTLAVGVEKGSEVTFEDACAEWLRFSEHDHRTSRNPRSPTTRTS